MILHCRETSACLPRPNGVAGEPHYGWGHGPGIMDWRFEMGWFDLIVMGIFWIFIIAVVILLIRWLAVSSSSNSQGFKLEESALEILKKRYAQREINKEKFEQKKRDLA